MDLYYEEELNENSQLKSNQICNADNNGTINININNRLELLKDKIKSIPSTQPSTSTVPST